VRARVAGAAARVGRDPAAVRLVVVGKGFPVADLVHAAAAGAGDFGENRVQEALPKMAALPGVRWHLIGQLQRNKARAAVGRFCLIHSVDRVELAESLQRAAAGGATPQRVLLQVGLTGRPGQGGIPPALAPELLRRILGHPALRPVGLMTIAPPVADAEEARPAFATLRALRDRLEVEVGVPLPELSMGMSGDFEVAVEEGATLVRVGRAIFGARPAPGRGAPPAAAGG
jgi:pyridoxal phosphate enzyme (YggS family)